MDMPRHSTCLLLPVTIAAMTGDQIRAARERRGWTQAELAAAIGVGARTVGNWERGETVPKNRLGKLRELFGDNDTNGNPLTDLSDLDLLTELTRRAVVRMQRTG